MGSPFRISDLPPESRHDVSHPLAPTELIHHFVHAPHEPIVSTALKPPLSNLDTQKAKEQIATHDLLHLTPGGPHEMNKETLKRVEKKGFGIIEFAKKHPFLTAGFILGVILLLCSFPIIASSFASITGITLFHAKIAVGLGLGLATLYYGVYLINLARRAAVKDDLELKLESQGKLRDTLLKDTSGTHLKEFLEKLKSDATTIQKTGLSTMSSLKSTHEEKTQLLSSQTTELDKLRKSTQTLQSVIASTNFSQLSPILQDQAKAALKKAEEEIVEGQKALSTALFEESVEHSSWEPIGWEPSFVLPVPPSDLLIPTIPKEVVQDRQAVQKSIGQKLTNVCSFLTTFVKENPGSTGLIVLGVVFTLVTIPALIFLLSGHANIYLIGTLSVLGVVQFAIYGISLILEGYNSATIKKLKKELEKIEENMQAHLDAYEKMEHNVQDFREKALQSVLDYQQNWQKAISSVQTAYKLEGLAQSSFSNRTQVIDECQQKIQEILVELLHIPSSLLPDPSAQKKPLEELAGGAIELSSFHS